MNYKDLLTLVIILSILVFTGLRIAEQGLYTTMGINQELRTFNFKIVGDRNYDVWVLGKNLSFQKTYKIGDFYADKATIYLKMQGRQFYINPLISFVPPLKSLNLDKNPIELYN